MTINFQGCRMTANDFQICSGMLRKLGNTDSPLLPLLQEKTKTAIIVAAEHMDPLVVTLNSRVEFAVDGETPETRIVVQSDFRHGLVGLTLPITTPRALALLGLRQGQSRSFEEHGRTRNLLVPRILYQPEARRFMRDGKRRYRSSAKVIDLIDARNSVAAGGRQHGDTSSTSS